MKSLLLAITLLTYSCSIYQSYDKNNLYNHVKFLASDKLEGRYPGTEGDLKAANYIKNEFKKNGLSHLNDKIQKFDFISKVKLGSNNRLKFKGSNFNSGSDFNPISFGSNATYSGKIIFVGYGFSIKNDSLDWNDYKDIDASDKWVMILRGSPDGNNPHSSYSDNTSLRQKAILAKDNLAAGIIFVSGEGFDKEDELIPLSFDQGQQDIGIPVVHIKRDVANQLLTTNKTSIETLENSINKDLQNSEPFTINEMVTIQTEVLFEKSTTQNVVGLLEGNDISLKDEYIVIGAHYDHIGFGGDKSGSRRPYIHAIHNGADDNASGVSILIELSKILGQLKTNKRSILFVAFGAEEMGLLGSKHFVNSNLISNDKIQIMINLDMVGRLNSEKTINVSGTKTAANLESIITPQIKNNGLNFTFSSEGYGPSDHTSFYVNDVPVLFFFTGAHTDYHTPSDDYHKLNYSGMETIKTLLHELIEKFDGIEKLEFQESGPKKASRPSRFKVTLGIMPDYVFNEKKGLRIDAVIPNKPAFNAGLLDGDIIIKIDNKPVNDIYEYMHRLSEIKSGQTVNIVVMRGEKEINQQVTF